jgi:cyclopropane-fatty-acyl-phospholipid synthase
MSGHVLNRARLPLLEAMFDVLIRHGKLTVIDAAGRQSSFGPGAPGPHVVIGLHRRWLPLRLALDPMLAVGEAYMDGTVTIEQGDVRDFLLLTSAGIEDVHRMRASGLFARLQRLSARLVPANDRRRSRRNVESHYELPPAFFDLFLDRDQHYSCAYFRTGDEDLEAAQQAKVRHIMAKLLLRPGDQVLDIGCGWGALAVAIATKAGVAVQGLTLSAAQLRIAEARARHQGAAGATRFALRDYRDETGPYDRIVSVGMLEHVGAQGFDTYFAKIAALLHDDGVAVIHSIGTSMAVSDTGSASFTWLNRHVFPGGYIPALSEIVPAVERAGLWITDIEILRLHYADTLHCWWNRFATMRGAAQEMLGERFCRMWEFYLAACEAGFRNGRLMVFQLQLAKRIDAVPRTRDYIAEAEQRLDMPASPGRVRAA